MKLKFASNIIRVIKLQSDTGKQLTWFKGIDHVQGTVEKQSLTLVREINERGIYLIEGTNLGSAVSYKECVRLTVPSENNDGISCLVGLHDDLFLC